MNHLNDEQLNRYIDQEAAIAEVKIINEHLLQCSACLNKLETLKGIHSGLMSMKVSVPSPGFTAAFMAKLELSIKRKRQQKYFITFILGLFAFIILGVLGYLVSISSFDFSFSADAGKYAENFTSRYNEIVTGMQKYTSGKNITLIGSVLSMGIIISAYFFYNSHKTFKNILK